jgi:hypothetical protein
MEEAPRAPKARVVEENFGYDPLIANRVAIGPWEEFDLLHD